jgi:uncharacterized protein RhaS with RHS repeats
MRFVVAVALAASVAGAAWAVEPAKTLTTVEKTSAITEVAQTKEWSTAHCWICNPSDRK